MLVPAVLTKVSYKNQERNSTSLIIGFFPSRLLIIAIALPTIMTLLPESQLRSSELAFNLFADKGRQQPLQITVVIGPGNSQIREQSLEER